MLDKKVQYIIYLCCLLAKQDNILEFLSQQKRSSYEKNISTKKET